MKRMKRIIGIVLCVFMLLGVCVPLTGCVENVERLVVYNWEEYIDESVLDDFVVYYKEKTGKDLEIVYSKFDTNETMLTKVMNGDANIDIMCPSEYAIEKLLKADKIEKLDKNPDKYPYLANVYQDIYEKVSQTFGLVDGKDITEYFVPYMWGTLGILYNTEMVSEEEVAEAGWGLLWNSIGKESLEGQIYMKDSIRDAYAAAVLYAKERGELPASYENYSIGNLINCTDNEMLVVAERMLTEQKSHLKGYEVDFGKSDLARGVGAINLAWSGDALYAIEDLAPENDIELNYYTPDVGANVWFDGWVLSKDAKNKECAMEFINYLCMPEVAIKNAVYIGYTSGVDKIHLEENEDVLAILEENEYDAEEFFSSEIRYPDINSETFGVMRDFGDKNQTLVTTWERVKSSGDNLGTLLVILIVVCAVWAVLIAIALIAKYSNRTKKIIR